MTEQNKRIRDMVLSTLALGTFTFHTPHGKEEIYCSLEQAKHLCYNEVKFNGYNFFSGVWETITNRVYI